tara:strand:- start:245 stop:463 length:219 start_codon:yes stop_codon:yes gene_type:complete
MSPEMLTLVAEVLAYERARDKCDRPSSKVETEEPRAICRRCSLAALGLSLKDKSFTKEEKDIVCWPRGFCVK